MSALRSSLRTLSLGLILFPFALDGCAPKKPAAKPLLNEKTAQKTVLSATDTSDSDRKTLPIRTEELGRLPLCISSGSTQITVYRFDFEPREVCSIPMPETDEELLSEMAEGFAPAIGRDYTFLDKLLQVLAKRARLCNGPCVILISTDGFCEGMDAKAHQAALAASQELANNKHVVAADALRLATQTLSLVYVLDRYSLLPLCEEKHRSRRPPG